jgi:hypothetical protein
MVMTTTVESVPSTEAAILPRLIHPEQANLSSEAARALLELRFDQQDLDRLHELVMKTKMMP